MKASDSVDERAAGAVLDIDLGAIAENYRRLRATAPGSDCAAVVKADAYGLGAAQIAPVLRYEGCRDFFVALLAEGIALRGLLPDARIHVLNGLLADTEQDFVDHRLVPVLNDLEQIDRWAARGRAEGPLPAIVHLDTGMNRLGLGSDETAALIAAPDRLDGIDLRYWMSHLVAAEDAGSPLAAEQRRRLVDWLGRLPPAPVSLANSSGIFRGAEFAFDLLRPGVALYGVNPTPGAPNPMRPVVALRARILQVRDVDSPMTVGYGATHRVGGKGKIATISVGYADGFLRSLSGAGFGVIAGRRVPVVGRVSMDLVTLDVGDVPASALAPGAFVELIGPHHTIDELAVEAGTIGYEILTALGRRYCRRYHGGLDHGGLD